MTQEKAQSQSGRRRRVVRILGRVAAGTMAAALAGAGLTYLIADRARSPLDAAARELLVADGRAGSFVETTHGTMHVRLSGPEDGPAVLLIHGGVVGGFGFENWRGPLAAAGYRVVVPDPPAP